MQDRIKTLKSWSSQYKHIYLSNHYLFEQPKACNFIKKETLAQVFSFEFCEILKNTFSYRTLPVTAMYQIQARHHVNFFFFLREGYVNLGPLILDNIRALVKALQNKIAESWQLNNVTSHLLRLYSFEKNLTQICVFYGKRSNSILYYKNLKLRKT